VNGALVHQPGVFLGATRIICICAGKNTSPVVFPSILGFRFRTALCTYIQIRRRLHIDGCTYEAGSRVEMAVT
jgi:hypothetical protein